MQELHRDRISDGRNKHPRERPVLREVIVAERRLDGIIGRSAALTTVRQREIPSR